MARFGQHIGAHLKTGRLRFGAVLVAMVLASLSLAGCSGQNTAPPGGSAKQLDPNAAPMVATFPWGQFKLNDRTAAKLRSGDTNLNFVFVGYGTGSSFYSAVQLGMNEGAKAVGVNARLIGPTDFSPEQQAVALESVLQTDVDGLAVQCSVAGLLTPLINKAADSGIPVMLYGEDCPEAHRMAWVGQLYDKAGMAAAETFLKYFRQGHPKGSGPYEVALIAGATAPQYATGRFEGFKQGLAGETDITFVGPFDTSYDPAAAYTVVENIFKGNPGLDGLFAADEEILSAGEYLQRNGLAGKVTAVGFNLPAGVPELIQKNAIQASVGQFTYQQGRQPVEMLHKFLTAGQLPDCTICDLGAHVITTENIGTFIGTDEARKEG